MDNMRDCLAPATVPAVGGTWIATRLEISQGLGDAIRAKCAAARTAAEIIT